MTSYRNAFIVTLIASLALAAGADLKVIADQLGPCSIVLTADTYTSVLPDVARKAAEDVATLIIAAGCLVPGTTRPCRPVRLGRGGTRLLYTDGVTDERRDADEFGETRLHEALSELTGAGAQRIADGVVDAVVGFRTGQPKDDIAILAIKVVG